MWSLSQNTLLYCTPPSSGDDVDDNLLDVMKWGEWHKHCDISSGDYWPSDSTSEGGSSASGDPGSWSHDDVNG